MKLIPITLCLLFLTNAIAETDSERANKHKQIVTNNIMVEAMGGEAAQQYNRGYYYLTGTGDVKQSDTEARKWFDLAAKSNVPGVRYKIGRLYETGTLYNQSYTEAVKHYSYAADKGDIYAINNLAILYLNGTGVTKNADKGIRLLTIAAEKGNTEAQINLGLYYLASPQKENNIKNALKWFKEAGKAHNPVALYYLAEHAFAELDYVKAYDYYVMSAQQSHDSAHLKLALLYAKGLGVEKNIGTATDWLTKAAKLGNKKAIGMLQNTSRKR
jgi:TPR repeat protein